MLIHTNNNGIGINLKKICVIKKFVICKKFDFVQTYGRVNYEVLLLINYYIMTFHDFNQDFVKSL